MRLKNSKKGKVQGSYFRELYKNNKHTCNQSIFDALGRALQLQCALLVMISNLQDSTSLKSNFENCYLVLELFNANELIK